MFTLLSYAIVLATVILLAAHLRVFAQDTFNMLRREFRSIAAGGRMMSSLAFGGLWMLIFGLAYM